MSISDPLIHIDDLCQVFTDLLRDPTGVIYVIRTNTLAGDGKPVETTLKFHAGAVENGINGISNEALLAVLINRTSILQSRLPCDENVVALRCMDEAMEAFKRRRNASKGRQGIVIETTTPTGWDDSWLRKALERDPNPLSDVGKDYFDCWTAQELSPLSPPQPTDFVIDASSGVMALAEEIAKNITANDRLLAAAIETPMNPEFAARVRENIREVVQGAQDHPPIPEVVDIVAPAEKAPPSLLDYENTPGLKEWRAQVDSGQNKIPLPDPQYPPE